MKKVLKFEIISQTSKQTVLKVIEQSHRNYKFGLNSHAFYFGGCEISIKSSEYPDGDGLLHSSPTLFVRGRKTKQDDDVIIFDTSLYQGVERIIHEYNNFEFLDDRSVI